METNSLLEIIKKLQTHRQESKTVDAKRELVLQENGDKAEFVKDVIAMGNNGEESYLVIGLEDGTFTPVGPVNRHYSKNDLNQILAGKIDPPLVVDCRELKMEGNEYTVIKIFGRDPPYLVARDLIHNKHDRKKVRIYKGTIYVRHADRTEGISRSELNEFFRSELRRAYEAETDRALELALNQPRFWEYFLTAELLQSKAARVRRDFTDMEKGLVYERSVPMKGAEFMNWINVRFKDLANIITLLQAAITGPVQSSWGKPGEPGDPLEIKRAVEQVIRGCDELLKWEIELRSVVPPKPFIPLKQMMAGCTAQVLNRIEDIPDRILEPILQRKPEGKYVIDLGFEPPPNIAQVVAEIERLTNNPDEWMHHWP